jgi:predicted membrane protein
VPARSYVEFSNELDALVPYSVSISVSSSILYGSLETQCHEYLVFASYLEVV